MAHELSIDAKWYKTFLRCFVLLSSIANVMTMQSDFSRFN